MKLLYEGDHCMGTFAKKYSRNEMLFLGSALASGTHQLGGFKGVLRCLLFFVFLQVVTKGELS